VLTPHEREKRVFLRREEGASAVEYAILIALIASAIFLTVTVFGVEVMALFQRLAQAFP